MYFSKPEMSSSTLFLAQIIKEEIKREVMNELWARQGYYCTPCVPPHRVENTVLDPKENFVKETGQLNIMGERLGGMGYHSYTGEEDGTLLDKWNESPVAFYVDDKGLIPEWAKDPAIIDRGKEILYGIGTAALLGIFMPSFGKRFQAILSRATSEGLELVEKARAIAARAREDVEDLIAEANLPNLIKKPR